MKTLNLTIKGRIPSKKNSRLIFSQRGRVINIPSNKYREWHKNATASLSGTFKPLNKASLVRLSFYMPDKRRTDLTNKAESILDFLVDNNILADDSWQVVSNICLECKGIDRENPRCEVTIQS